MTTPERPQTGERQDRWLVNVANGGGWTVSLHTEEEYTEFVMYTRHEADELADYLNASLAPPAQDGGEWRLEWDKYEGVNEMWCGNQLMSPHEAVSRINALEARVAALEGVRQYSRGVLQRIASLWSGQYDDAAHALSVTEAIATNALTAENAALRARLELTEGVADEVIANLERVGKGEYERGKQEADADLRARAEQTGEQQRWTLAGYPEENVASIFIEGTVAAVALALPKPWAERIVALHNASLAPAAQDGGELWWVEDQTEEVGRIQFALRHKGNAWLSYSADPRPLEDAAKLLNALTAENAALRARLKEAEDYGYCPLCGQTDDGHTHCSCRIDPETGETTVQCVAHTALRARAEQAEAKVRWQALALSSVRRVAGQMHDSDAAVRIVDVVDAALKPASQEGEEL